MAKNLSGLTATTLGPITLNRDSDVKTPIVLPQDIRGALASYTTAERDALDGRMLDNNMIIAHVDSSGTLLSYQTYRGGTRDASGFLTGGSWTNLSLGSDAEATDSDYGISSVAHNAATGVLTITLRNGDTITATIADSDTTYSALTDGGLTLSSDNEFSIAAGGVDTAELADDAVTGAKVAAAAIDSDHIADRAVETAKIEDRAVTGVKVATDAIDSEHIADALLTQLRANTTYSAGNGLELTGGASAGVTLASSNQASRSGSHHSFRFATAAEAETFANAIAAAFGVSNPALDGFVTLSSVAVAANTLAVTITLNHDGGTATHTINNGLSTSARPMRLYRYSTGNEVRIDRTGSTAVAPTGNALAAGGTVTGGSITHGANAAVSFTAGEAVGGTTFAIEDGAIDTVELADAAVTHAKLATDAVDSDNILDGAVETAKLADDAVTGAKVADNAIDSDHIADAFLTRITTDTTYSAGNGLALSGTTFAIESNAIDSDEITAEIMAKINAAATSSALNAAVTRIEDSENTLRTDLATERARIDAIQDSEYFAGVGLDLNVATGTFSIDETVTATRTYVDDEIAALAATYLDSDEVQAMIDRADADESPRPDGETIEYYGSDSDSIRVAAGGIDSEHIASALLTDLRRDTTYAAGNGLTLTGVSSGVAVSNTGYGSAGSLGAYSANANFQFNFEFASYADATDFWLAFEPTGLTRDTASSTNTAVYFHRGTGSEANTRTEFTLTASNGSTYALRVALSAAAADDSIRIHKPVETNANAAATRTVSLVVNDGAPSINSPLLVSVDGGSYSSLDSDTLDGLTFTAVQVTNVGTGSAPANHIQGAVQSSAERIGNQSNTFAVASNAIDSDELSSGILAKINAGNDASTREYSQTQAGLVPAYTTASDSDLILTAAGWRNDIRQVVDVGSYEDATLNTSAETWANDDVTVPTTGAVQGAIEDHTIDSDQLADRAVETAKIENLAVTTAKIADDAVNADKIADGAISNVAIAADAAIAGSKIAANSIDSDRLDSAFLTRIHDAIDEAHETHVAYYVDSDTLERRAGNVFAVADNGIDSDQIADVLLEKIYAGGDLEVFTTTTNGLVEANADADSELMLTPHGWRNAAEEIGANINRVDSDGNVSVRYVPAHTTGGSITPTAFSLIGGAPSFSAGVASETGSASFSTITFDDAAALEAVANAINAYGTADWNSSEISNQSGTIRRGMSSGHTVRLAFNGTNFYVEWSGGTGNARMDLQASNRIRFLGDGSTTFSKGGSLSASSVVTGFTLTITGGNTNWSQPAASTSARFTFADATDAATFDAAIGSTASSTDLVLVTQDISGATLNGTLGLTGTGWFRLRSSSSATWTATRSDSDVTVAVSAGSLSIPNTGSNANNAASRVLNQDVTGLAFQQTGGLILTDRFSQNVDASWSFNYDGAADATQSVTDLEARLDSEIVVRAAEDTAVEARLDSEIVVRAAADTANATAITAETTARTAADTALETRLDSEIVVRAAADTSVRTDFAAADSALTTRLDSEQAARIAGDSSVRTAFAAADTALEVRLDSEITLRASEITRVEGLITSGETNYQSRDSELQTSIDNIIDSEFTSSTPGYVAASGSTDSDYLLTSTGWRSKNDMVGQTLEDVVSGGNVTFSYSSTSAGVANVLSSGVASFTTGSSEDTLIFDTAAGARAFAQEMARYVPNQRNVFDGSSYGRIALSQIGTGSSSDVLLTISYASGNSVVYRYRATLNPNNGAFINFWYQSSNTTRIRLQFDPSGTDRNSRTRISGSDPVSTDTITGVSLSGVVTAGTLGLPAGSSTASLSYDASALTTADSELEARLDSEITVRAAADTALHARIDSDRADMLTRISNVSDDIVTFDSEVDGFVPQPGDSDSTDHYLAGDGSWRRISSVTNMTSFTALSDTPADYTSASAGDFLRTNTANNALEFFDPFGTLNSDNVMTTLNGMTIRGFNSTEGSAGIEFAVWSWRDISVAYAPRQTLRWDEALTTITLTGDNWSDFQTEYVTNFKTGSVNVDNSMISPGLSDLSYAATWSRAIAMPVSPSRLGGDPRNGSWDGTSGGSRNWTATLLTNNRDSETESGSFSWGAAGYTSAAFQAASQRFDVVNTTYSVRGTVQDTANHSNIGSHGARDNSAGSASSASRNGNTYTYSVSGATVYHDTTVSGEVYASFNRPAAASADGSARTFMDSEAYSGSNTSVYPVWAYVKSGAYALADLGTLGNSGYATTPASATGTVAGTYVATAGAAAQSWHLVTQTTLGATAFADVSNAALPLTLTPTSQTVTLGHSGHTVSYNVYTINVPANRTLNIRVTV